MVKKSIPVPVGEVILVSKPTPPPAPEPPKEPEPPKMKEITPSAYEKIRPRAPRSEKQMEHAKRLAQLNKDRAKALREALVVKEPELTVVPEDKELVRIKPKRVYKPRAPKVEPKNEIVTPAPSETESEAEVVFKPPRKVPMKPQNIQPYSEPETEEEPPRRVRKPKPTKPKRIPTHYVYETEPTTTEAESESESDDDYKIQKYTMKAEKRMNALRKIDNRLQQLNTNPYQSRNFSIF